MRAHLLVRLIHSLCQIHVFLRHIVVGVVRRQLHMQTVVHV
ncbi:pterin-4-alpha-carbinolamine dehyddrogenase [Leishmania tarentolae]|uniref:Pterin-4-alpha-carbinolamine dehyddrogenase n=1 Tax=Leishmania tarentolae TaxID=5689 RepID=A0A640KY92_LEITA|nr:pterin-4-alpha-carbinolamine dehyddrogenase [Leishmania tarentolae]